MERAIPTTRRPVPAGRLEPAGVRPPRRAAGAVHALEAEPAGERRDEPLDRRGVHGERAHPLRPEQPLLGGQRVQVGAEVLEPERDRAGRLGAVDDDERATVVGDLRDGPDRHDGTGRPQHVRDRDEPGVGGDGRVEGGDRPGVVAVVTGVDDGEVDVEAVADRVQRTDAAGVLVGGRHRPAAGPPVRAAAWRRSSRRSSNGSARPRRRPCRGPRRRPRGPRPSGPMNSAK